MTPHEKLKSLGYPQGQELCLFPTLILDKVCTLDIFQKKRRKSVPDHIDYYRRRHVALLVGRWSKEAGLDLPGKIPVCIVEAMMIFCVDPAHPQRMKRTLTARDTCLGGENETK